MQEFHFKKTSILEKSILEKYLHMKTKVNIQDRLWEDILY